ncbi:MAG TPA: hypothetical protein VKH45_15030 [Candidatus Acidoferrum sp.]|nr:hypothetical protein [Candidatus Acidoferrum sp.]
MAAGKPAANPDRQTISHAIDLFLKDKKVQNRATSTLYKLDLMFRKQLGEWCKNNALVYLHELTRAQLEKFRASWSDTPPARKKKQERISGFFGYCQRHKWITDTPLNLSRVFA